MWVGGVQRFEAEVRLTKRETVEEIETLGGTNSVPLETFWDGRFRGLSGEDLRPLQGVDGGFEVRGLLHDSVTTDLWCREAPLGRMSPCPSPIQRSSATTS